MGDLSKLKVAVGQPELVEGLPSRAQEAQERLVEQALEAGADLLIFPASLVDSQDIHVIALNDSRIDVAGSVVIVEAAGERYRIGLGEQCPRCDFTVFSDVDPWNCAQEDAPALPGIVLRPVGMRNCGHKVFAYDGGTCVRSADGALLARLRDDFESDFQLVSLVEKGRVVEPCRDKLLACLVKTLRRFDEQVLGGSMKWVIGLSGGLDSSVVAALLTLALGPERIVGYNLATAFNTQATKGNAAAIAEALGITLKNGSIADVVAATELVANQYGYGSAESPALTGLVLENVQARTRGFLLSTFSALEGGVVVNNGNRVESAFGYATLYGDAIGAIAPIGDITKVRLFDLARAINGQPGCEVIPENLLPRETAEGCEWDVMPSAELAEGQTDPMKWFYHDWVVEQLLDAPSVDSGACAVLSRYADDRLQGTPVGKWCAFYGLLDPQAFLDDFDWVMRSLRVNAFKRIQSPPVITVASRASIAAPPEVQGPIEPSARYRELHDRIRGLSKQQ